MLSHLRFHRRGSSSPSSPVAEQQQHHPRDAPPPPDGALSPDARPSSSGSSTLPSKAPTLPPIAGVTPGGPSFDLPDFSASATHRDKMRDHVQQRDAPREHAQQRGKQPPMRSPYDQGTGFIGGVALEKYRREAARRQESDVPAPETQHLASPQPSTLPTSPNTSSGRPSTSFVTPTDLRSGVSPTGRMPQSNARLPEPYPSAAALPVEHSRAKKGLPFLKNPMSTLLMRRKAGQNVSDLIPPPLQISSEPTYDPRIRGTRVHDFSAPRPRKPATQAAAAHDPPTARESPGAKPPPVPLKSSLRHQGEAAESTGPPRPLPGRQVSSGTESTHPSVFTGADTPSTKVDAPSSISSKPSLKPSLDKPLPPRASPPIVPPKDNVSAPESRSSTTARSSTRSGPKPGAGASMRSARSGSLSRAILSRGESLSSIPKHMKSTSSRFSFDMIGAAKQEKLLEERHRQRQLERRAESLDLGSGARDSRFDDFDDFDYDAMMDDDGLEEAIPGVNADYEEEPIPGMEDDYEEPIPGVNIDYDGEMDDYDPIDDPDNDQENFAGFVFERSPQSALAGPDSAGFAPTPRDDDGNAIGFACSKDSPMDQDAAPEPLSIPEKPSTVEAPDELAGLGIQTLAASDVNEPTNEPMNEARYETTEEATNETTKEAETPQGIGMPPDQPRPADGRDDLYFDDGMIGDFSAEFVDELDFSGDAEPFDEALFDLDDTDQYGRPIPGAFKAAKEAYAARHMGEKRESDGASGPFEPVMSPSTTHTSVSAPGPPHPVVKVASEEVLPENPCTTFTQAAAAPPADDVPFAAYQAALAAAAHKAAADGKFRRESPPRSPAPLPTEARPASSPDTDDYDAYDEPEPFDFDDYERDDVDFDVDLDDDDIIAEANASALANDAEGWYGSEFGFYSDPTPQQGLPFEYANGGYFGPSQAAGRGAVSREPNLTPITERSEYSNRNSVMSMAVPPIGSAGSMQSPGLAQLAMMSDGDDNMTLSALLRLRTKAWGGSQASVGSSRDGSPRSERGEGAGSPQGVMGAGPQARMAGLSALGHEARAGSLPGSPTLTGAVLAPSASISAQSAPSGGAPGRSVSGATNASTAVSSAVNGSPAVSGAGSPCEERNPARGHRKKGSSGSISYVREEEGAEARWVVERRRTDDTGVVEVEREVLPGGRI